MATAVKIRAIGQAIEYYRPRFDALGIDSNRVLLETLWRLDAKQTPKNKFGEKRPGIPCGKSYISWRKKCSESNSKTATARLKGTAEGKAYANRVRKSKGLVRRKGELSQREKNYKLMLRREDELRLNNFETMQVYSPDTMKKRVTIPGDKYEVKIPESHEAKLKDAIVTHNHPRGWEFPESDPRRSGNGLSNGDVMVAAYYDVSEMRAVSVGHRYSLKRPKDGWGNWKDVERVLEEAETETRMDIQGRIQAILENEGLEAAEAYLPQAESIHHHEKLKRFSSMYGAPYSREKWKAQNQN